MKNAMRCWFIARRVRSAALRASPSPPSDDMAGSAAAVIALPKSVTGSNVMDCASPSAATALAEIIVANCRSTKLLTCRTPRLINAGAKLRATVRTAGSSIAGDSDSPRSSESTAGSCTRNCSALPIIAPHATSRAASSRLVRRPNSTAAMIARFHITGDTYDRKNRR